MMKIVFFGSSEFAIKPLEAILAGKYEVCLVVTQPDRAKGRGMKVSATAVKELAVKRDIAVYQPSVFDAKCVETLRSKQADLFVVVSYGNIIPKYILDIPRIFCINLHASLLPKYRGASPINWVIIKGEKKTGVSIIRMNETMDAGDILSKEEIVINPGDHASTLRDKLSLLGSKKLIEVIDSVKKGKFKLTKQDRAKATFAPKLKKEDGLIDWSHSSQDIQNLIRGLIPWPCAFTYYNGTNIKIWKCIPVKEAPKDRAPGEVVRTGKDGITIKAGKGAIVIKELQPAGSRVMTSGEFIAGHRIKPGDTLTTRKVLQ